MNLSVGIVGLPNVGKSTLFNALLKKQQALAANYPFATIEPNVGVVPVPDERLNRLAEITKEEEKMSALPPIRPATVEFVDIAGLVKGASEGAGLGNKFLSHIREVQIIAHVVRAFEDPDIVRYEDQINKVDPHLRQGFGGQAKTDFETINTELMLADLATLQKSLENRKIDFKNKVVIDKAIAGIDANIPIYLQKLTTEEKEELKDLFLLSGKPQIVVLNVSEQDYIPEKINDLSDQYTNILATNKENIVVISAQIESDLAALSEEEQKEYLRGLGLEKSGLERLIQKAYEKLGLISFLTAGEKEIRAWTIKKGSTALQASGEIHTDFIKKFIKAEVVNYIDFITNSGWKGSRDHGKARLEGKDYAIQDGDIVEFKIGS